MELMKYKNVLTMAKDAIKQVMAPIRAKEMKKKAELEIVKIEGSMAEMEQNIQEQASKYPIDFDAMINSIDELSLLQRRKSQFEDIVNKLFED